MMVKTLQDEHLCQAVRNNKNATSTWITRVLGPEFLADPNMRLKNIRKKLKDKFGVTGLSKAKLFRARVKARGGTLESHIAEFQKLRWYANMVLRTNPGSMAIVRSEVTRLGGLPHFQRIFICLEACKRGFLTGCRPVVGLDGCHLKGPYGGVLLAAISVEANMGYFPLAYAIAEIENQKTWCWFLEHLKEAVGRDLEMKPWCIISNRQKVSELYSFFVHSFIFDELLTNFGNTVSVLGIGKCDSRNSSKLHPQVLLPSYPS